MGRYFIVFDFFFIWASATKRFARLRMFSLSKRQKKQGKGGRGGGVQRTPPMGCDLKITFELKKYIEKKIPIRQFQTSYKTWYQSSYFWWYEKGPSAEPAKDSQITHTSKTNSVSTNQIEEIRLSSSDVGFQPIREDSPDSSYKTIELQPITAGLDDLTNDEPGFRQIRRRSSAIRPNTLKLAELDAGQC